MSDGYPKEDSLARERKLFQKYPFHVYLMVKAAAEAFKKGRAKIEDGMLIVEKDSNDVVTKEPDTDEK